MIQFILQLLRTYHSSFIKDVENKSPSGKGVTYKPLLEKAEARLQWYLKFFFILIAINLLLVGLVIFFFLIPEEFKL